MADRLEPSNEILLSVLEHHSNLVPWQMLAERRGVVLRFLPMTPDGRLDLEWLETELTERCRLVALTHCSNVTDAMTDVTPKNLCRSSHGDCIVEAARIGTRRDLAMTRQLGNF